MIQISDIKLPFEHAEAELHSRIREILGISSDEMVKYKIRRRSIDARKKSGILFVYTVGVELADEKSILRKSSNQKIVFIEECPYEFRCGSRVFQERPVVIGTGPAGLFAALVLAQAGKKPLLLERGKPVEERALDVERFISKGILDENSNIQFGEGGAGTFSDGKLTTLIRDPACQRVLEELVRSGAPEEILFQHKPHIGTDILRKVVVNLRERIKELGGEFKFNHEVIGIRVEEGRVRALEIRGWGSLDVETVLLAPGNSARGLFENLLAAGVNIIPKAFSVGVRIEHLQEAIDRAQFGKYAGNPKLGAAEYKLAYHCQAPRSVYTFCMCPGGWVVGGASESGGVVTNGMSEHARDFKNANSAVLVGITPNDFGSSHPLAGVAFQRELERKAFKAGGSGYSAPVEDVGSFLGQGKGLRGKEVIPSYRPGVQRAKLDAILPGFAVNAIREALPAFGNQLSGFDDPCAMLTGVETRSSSPVRIVRNDFFESNIKGIFPAGEGAGYAGGIISSAVDGIHAAEALTQQSGNI